MLRTAKTRAALAALLLALPAFAALANGALVETRDPRAHFFTQTFGDLGEEMQLAREEGKLGMLLFFEAEDCQYCQYMLRKILSQQQVQDWYNERFVSIAIDIHGDVEITDFDGITLPSKVFSDHRRIFLTPVVAFVNLDGAEIYRHLGMIRTPEEFLLLGEYIEDGHYFDTEYRVFAASRGFGDEGGARLTPAEDTQ
jgi:thioredoxin-related protein